METNRDHRRKQSGLSQSGYDDDFRVSRMHDRGLSVLLRRPRQYGGRYSAEQALIRAQTCHFQQIPWERLSPPQENITLPHGLDGVGVRRGSQRLRK